MVHPTKPQQAIRQEFLDNPEGLDLQDFVRVMVKYLDVQELKDMSVQDLDLHIASASASAGDGEAEEEAAAAAGAAAGAATSAATAAAGSVELKDGGRGPADDAAATGAATDDPDAAVGEGLEEERPRAPSKEVDDNMLTFDEMERREKKRAVEAARVAAKAAAEAAEAAAKTSRALGVVSDLCELFAQIDANGDGSMEWEEFTGFIIEQGMTVQKDVVYHDVFEERCAFGLRTSEDKYIVRRIRWYPEIQRMFVCVDQKVEIFDLYAKPTATTNGGLKLNHVLKVMVTCCTVQLFYSCQHSIPTPTATEWVGFWFRRMAPRFRRAIRSSLDLSEVETNPPWLPILLHKPPPKGTTAHRIDPPPSCPALPRP